MSTLIKTSKRPEAFLAMLKRVSNDRKVMVKIKMSWNDSYNFHKYMMPALPSPSNEKVQFFIVTALNLDYEKISPNLLKISKSSMFMVTECKEDVWNSAPYIEYDMKTSYFVYGEDISILKDFIQNVRSGLTVTSGDKDLTECQFNALMVMFPKPVMRIRFTGCPVHRISTNRVGNVHFEVPSKLGQKTEAIPTLNPELHFCDNKAFVLECVTTLVNFINQHKSNHIKFELTPEQRYFFEKTIPVKNNDQSTDKYMICVDKTVIAVGKKKYDRLKYPVWSLEAQHIITTEPIIGTIEDGIKEETFVSTIYTCSDGSKHNNKYDAELREKCFAIEKIIPFHLSGNDTPFKNRGEYQSFVKWMAVSNIMVTKC